MDIGCSVETSGSNIVTLTSGSIAVGIALIITIHILLLLSTFSLSLASLLLFTWSRLG